MKCVILGGAGFIGTRTARRLRERDHKVRVLDVLEPQIHGEDVAKSAMLRYLDGTAPVSVGDVRDPVAVAKALDDAEAVLYFAASTGTGQSMYQVRKYSEVNVQGAAIFAEELARRKSQIRKVVVSSTRAVYGEGAYECSTHGRVYPNGRQVNRMELREFEPQCPYCGGQIVESPSRESDPSQPTSVYGITKLAQEQMLLNICDGLGIPVVALRYQNVYGPGQSLNNPYTGVLSIFSQLLLQGKEINIFEDGLPTRDFIFIDDIVEYNCRAVECASLGATICNVGSGERHTLHQIVNALGAAYGVEPKARVSGQFRVGDIRHAAADLSRLRAQLGAHEFVGFQEGVKRLAEWVTKQSIGASIGQRYLQSLGEMSETGLFRSAKGG
jgi:dTDP-L-rhamnose 4-epimerase